MTAETIIWSVAVALIIAALVALVVATFIVDMFDTIEHHFDPRLFKPKPWWVGRVARALDMFLYAILALFLLLFLRFWWRHGGP